jgi:hypothetical protein
VSFEVTSKAPMNWFMAPLLAKTGSEGTVPPVFSNVAIIAGF